MTNSAVRKSWDLWDNSLKLNIATSPAANWVRINSCGKRRDMEHIYIVMQCVRKAVLESRNTRIMIGNIA